MEKNGGCLTEKFIEVVIGRTFSLDRKLGKLRIGDFPSDAPRDFIGVLLQINLEIQKCLISLQRSIGNLKDVSSDERNQLEETIRGNAIRFSHLISFLHELIQFIEESNIEYIPQGIVYSIENLITKIQPNSKFMIYPQWRYNYEYIEIIKLLRRVMINIPSIEEIIGSFAERFVILSFPSAEKDNVLLHCIFGHEIGHFIDEVQGISSDILKDVKIDEKLLEEVVTQVSKTKFKAEQHGREEITLNYFIEEEKLKADFREDITKQLGRWIEELISDALAIHLFGPSYFFAFTEFILTQQDLDKSSKDHPSPRIRISLLLDELKERGYYNVFDKKTTHEIKKWRDFLSYTKEGEKGHLQKLYDSSMKSTIPKIKEKTNIAVKEISYTHQMFKSDTPMLTSSLLYLIPPNELVNIKEKGTKPASIVSILNAGWVFNLTQMDKLYKMLRASSPEEKLQAKYKFNQIILKAVELSEIHRIINEKTMEIENEENTEK